MSKRDAARAALSTVPSLHEGFHGPILAALADKGLVEPANGGEVVRAAGETRVASVLRAAQSDRSISAAIKYAGGQLRQCGVGLDDILSSDGGSISLEKLNAAAKDKPISFRLRLKGSLAAAHLID